MCLLSTDAISCGIYILHENFDALGGQAAEPLQCRVKLYGLAWRLEGFISSSMTSKIIWH